MLGEVIHGYRIDRVLSVEGGFGDVYLATHVESGAEAVVKVLKPEMSALRDVVSRFFNEARAAASIHHPGIVQIHNVGYHGDRAYLLMERLRGGDLESRLRYGPLPLEKAIMFLRQTAGAIGAAHERGIVHRDLKPANLFIVEDPDVLGGERVKVLDFGIAKLTADTGAGKTQGVFGTPAYMSPEQCASTGSVDARADLYSLGCIFYELVCGRPPFGHGGLELIAAHLRDTPAPPRAIAPALPPAIEQVILQLLEKQPDRRIPSCAALVAALDGAASSGMPAVSRSNPSAGTRVGAASPTTLGSATGATSMPRRRTRSAGAWIGMGAIVVAGGAFAAFAAVRSPGDGASNNVGVMVSGSRDAAPAAVADDASPVVADASPVVATIDSAPTVAATSGSAQTDAARREPDERSTSRTSPSVESKPAATSENKPAAADGMMSDQVARLNGDGKAEMLAGRPEKALPLFKRAYELKPTPELLFNIALAEYQGGNCKDARRTLVRLLGTWPKEPPAQKAQQLLDRIGTCP
jgi:eukaryotic-like serine/threonine-protein kinase